MTKKRDPRILLLLGILGPAFAAAAAAADPVVLPRVFADPTLAACALLLWAGLPAGMLFLAFRDFWKRLRPFPFECRPLSPETMIPLFLGSVFVTACVCAASVGLHGYVAACVERTSECRSLDVQEADRIQRDRSRDHWLDMGLRDCGKASYRYGLAGRQRDAYDPLSDGAEDIGI